MLQSKESESDTTEQLKTTWKGNLEDYIYIYLNADQH